MIFLFTSARIVLLESGTAPQSCSFNGSEYQITKDQRLHKLPIWGPIYDRHPLYYFTDNLTDSPRSSFSLTPYLSSHSPSNSQAIRRLLPSPLSAAAVDTYCTMESRTKSHNQIGAEPSSEPRASDREQITTEISDAMHTDSSTFPSPGLSRSTTSPQSLRPRFQREMIGVNLKLAILNWDLFFRQTSGHHSPWAISLAKRAQLKLGSVSKKQQSGHLS